VSQPIASFVVRFHEAMENEVEEERRYRIKVTHVQNENEMTFESFDEAMNYMKGSLDGASIKEL